VKPTRRPTPAPKLRTAKDLAALLAQRPDLVADALASPVDLDGHSPDARDARRRYGLTLAAQLYPGNLAAQVAVEAIIGELRLKPRNPELPEAVALLARRKDDARRQARWLVGVLREWPSADAGFDLARYFSPERRAALAGHDSDRLTAAERRVALAERRARAVLLAAVIDREKLRRALLTLAQHADATHQGHERLARNLASVLGFAGHRYGDAALRLFCRRHFARLCGLSAGQRFDYAKPQFPNLARDGEGKSSDEAAFRHAWKEVFSEHLAPDHSLSAASIPSPATERQAYDQRRRAHLRVMDAELRDYCRKHREILRHLSEAGRFAFASAQGPDAKETAYFIIERDAAGQSSAESAFRRAWQVVAAEHL
jgi:hypothetical protein